MANKDKDNLTEKLVGFYCNESNKKTFLNKSASYEAAGYSTDSPTWRSNVPKKFSTKKVKALIKEMMPNVAYDKYIIRKEYWYQYEQVKDNDPKTALKALDSMAKTESMFSTKDEGDVDVDKELARVRKTTQETIRKINEAKERERAKGNIVEMETFANGTTND